MEKVIQFLEDELQIVQDEIEQGSLDIENNIYEGTISNAQMELEEKRNFGSQLRKVIKFLNDSSDKRSELLRFSQFISDNATVKDVFYHGEKVVDRYLENLSNSAKRN
jgi:hypothetical protein